MKKVTKSILSVGLLLTLSVSTGLGAYAEEGLAYDSIVAPVIGDEGTLSKQTITLMKAKGKLADESLYCEGSWKYGAS